ncbi:MAG: AraC family transcriptional regulator ligand-binding domain-containing protein, partial [Pararhodobacter sp.]|nr:AraC family transcriptional regulator ligand-binding domain-containing protein [Pararhodobacter sp.]
MIHSAAKIVTLIETAGLKPGAIARLLRPIGVDPADLFDFDRSFTLAQVIAIFHAVLEASDDPTVAFRAGSRFKFTNVGVFGLAVMSQDDLRAALKFVLKFRQLSSPIIGLHLETGETGGDLHFSPLPGTVSDREIYPRLLDFNLAMFLALIADAIGRDDFVEAIELSERADALTFDQLAQAGHRVIRGAGRDVIRLKPWSLAAPLRQKSAVGSAIAQKLCSEALTSMPDKSKLASDVRAVIVANVEKPV